jgi:hypothetical protein
MGIMKVRKSGILNTKIFNAISGSSRSAAAFSNSCIDLENSKKNSIPVEVSRNTLKILRLR